MYHACSVPILDFEGFIVLINETRLVFLNISSKSHFMPTQAELVKMPFMSLVSLVNEVPAT